MPKLHRLSVAFLVFSFVSGAQTPANYSYQVLFTGRTLGYARVPDQQTLKYPAGKDPSEIAAKFLAQFKAAAIDTKLLQLRIGMGDNLAPDLKARTFQIEDRQVPVCGKLQDFYPPDIHISKSFFNYVKDPNATNPNAKESGWEIWCDTKGRHFIQADFYDNVAQFFVEAQYDVLVPGKHDFYFGSDYLQRVAEFLETSQEHRVRMLGENLLQATSVAPGVMNVEPRIPERFAKACHDNTGPHECYHTDFGPASLELPDSVLPWKRQFVLRGARRAFKSGNNQLFHANELKSYAGSAARLDPIFDEDNTEICVVSNSNDLSDPSLVLVPAQGAAKPKCFPLIAADKVCTASLHADPKLNHLESTCKSLYEKTKGAYDRERAAAPTDVTFLFKNKGDHLVAGLNHMFCTVPNPTPDPVENWSPFTGQTKICRPFPVQIPFFWSRLERPQADAEWESCEEAPQVPCPYALKAGPDGSVAVFGVVDPDLLTNVGTLNTAWINKRNRKWDTKTQVSAPDYALLQTLEFCNANEQCRNAAKVLLAQMSYARASQLVSTAKFASAFDVVITQASPEHDSGQVETKFTGKSPRFVLTPPMPTVADKEKDPLKDSSQEDPAANRPPKIAAKVYLATVSKKTPTAADSATAQPTWTLTNSVQTLPDQQEPTAPNTCQGKLACDSLGNRSSEWLRRQHHADGSVQAAPITDSGAASAFQQAVLFAMRKQTKADAAMIQRTDLFDVDRLSNELIAAKTVQDQINEILWKDDFVVVLHVTGATIRKLLKASAAFAQQDQNALATEIETGRDLLTLGIYKHPNDPDSYYINGAPMSDTALYTIATTDFVIGGDTGYANLAAPDVPPILRAEDFENPRVRPIGGLVCEEIMHSNATCLDMGLGDGYFNPNRKEPFDDTPGFSTRQHWSGFLRNFMEPRRPFLNSEQRTQQRRFWQVNLENLDFSESGLFIDHISATKADLGGISNPLVTTTGSSNVGADHKARAIYDYGWGTNYFLSDLSYLRNATTTKGISLADNILGSEFGGTVRIGTTGPRLGLREDTPNPWQRPSWLSFQYSVRYEREVTNPADTPVSLKGGLSTLLPTPKISNLYGKVGLRAEIGTTYLEAGVEEINSRGLLQQYQLTQNGKILYCQPGSSSLLCGSDPALNSAADSTPIAKEVQLASPFAGAFSTANFLVPGAYLNFFWKFPLWSRQDANRKDQSWYFTLTNKGDIYFNNPADTNVQTRYLDKLTPALSFPIWGGLSLTPKADFILYEDKVNRYHYHAISPSISISYTFSVREGMVWTRGLAYGAQTTTPSPAGSTH